MQLWLCVQVALTDSVFASLDARMEEMTAVKEEREATLGELREVLLSMWDSVGITEDDENRKFFERMLSSPARLHTHTHEKACICRYIAAYAHEIHAACNICCSLYAAFASAKL